MLSRLTIFTCIIFAFGNRVYAENDIELWNVQPGECVVSEKDEFCDTTLLVTLLKTNTMNPCVFVDSQWIGCFADNNNILRFPVIIRSNITVTLKDSTNATLALRTIDYRLIQSTPQRRRIRLPWSVF